MFMTTMLLENNKVHFPNYITILIKATFRESLKTNFESSKEIKI